MKIDLIKANKWLNRALEQRAKTAEWEARTGLDPDKSKYDLTYYLKMAYAVRREVHIMRAEQQREDLRIRRGGKKRNYSIMNQGR